MSASGLSLLAASLGGAILGAAYLGLLWVAVCQLPRERGGAALFVALALARAAMIMGALSAAAVLGMSASGLLAALLGFLVVRLAATRLQGRGTTGGPAWK